MAASVAALMASCAKEETSVPEEIVPEGYVKVEFAASSEQTKTILTGDGATKTVEWVKDDEIDLFYASGSTTAKAASSGASTTFTAVVPEEEAIYASYPSSVATFKAAESEDNKDSLLVTLPADQTGVFASANLAVAEMVPDGNSTFRNVSSFFKFIVSDASVDRIEVTAVGGESIAGTIQVCPVGEIAFGKVTGGVQTVSLSINGAGTYYAAILPNVTFSQGVLVKYMSAGAPVGTYFLNKDDFACGRGVVKSFGELQARMLDSYCVSPEGAGSKTGADWANAMDIAAFMAMADTEGISEEAHHAIGDMLDGVTFKFAAGTYDFGKKLELGYGNYGKYVSITFDGGYVDGAKSTTSRSVFTGNDTHRVLTVYKWAELTADGISFVHSKGSSGGDTAVKFSDKYSIGHFTNCSFENNTNTATGGAVNLGYGLADFTGCAFVGNTATYGAAVNVNNEGCFDTERGSGEIKFTGCTFDGNDVGTASSHCGGAIYYKSGGPLTVINCTFTGNKAYNAGAVACGDDASKSTSASFTGCVFGTEGHGNSNTNSGSVLRLCNCNVTISECSFSYNSGKYGTIQINSGGNSNLVINDCSFDHNTVSSQGGAIEQDGGSVRITNCSFTGNSATAEGGALYAEKTSKLYVDDCTFDGNSTGKCSSFFHVGGGVTAYFNGCLVKNHLSTGSAYGALSAMADQTVDIGFNNCTFINNNSGKDVNSTNTPWFNIGAINGTLLFSNSTIWGHPNKLQDDGTSYKNQGIIRVEKMTQTNTVKFVNSVVINTNGTSGAAFWLRHSSSGYSPTFQADFNIFSKWSNQTNATGLTLAGTGNLGGKSDTAISASSFSGFVASVQDKNSISVPETYVDLGTLPEGYTPVSPAEVSSAINSRSAAFYSWLDSIGALGKDCRGKTRANPTCPGAYDGNAM